MRKAMTMIGMCLMMGSGPAWSASLPVSGDADPRIKTVDYRSNDVVVLRGHYGYATTIRFEPFEKIENIAIGDQEAWQTLPNNARNILFVKPLADDANTNMTVITTNRVYHFDLSADDGGMAGSDDAIFELSFDYTRFGGEAASLPGLAYGSARYAADLQGEVLSGFPGAPSPVIYSSDVTPTLFASDDTNASSSTVDVVTIPDPYGTGSNIEYSMKGDAELAPSVIFDDGTFTYIKFAERSEIPAIFGVDKDRNESVLNHHNRDGYIVLESVHKQLTLRLGGLEACVINYGYPSDENLFQSGLALASTGAVQ